MNYLVGVTTFTFCLSIEFCTIGAINFAVSRAAAIAAGSDDFEVTVTTLPLGMVVVVTTVEQLVMVATNKETISNSVFFI